MQTTSSKIWTQATNSISYNFNNYAKHIKGWSGKFNVYKYFFKNQLSNSYRKINIRKEKKESTEIYINYCTHLEAIKITNTHWDVSNKVQDT